eukprot:CAMPEP_0116873810 /NCGR_PEP_ID=MMETSP0463-20121206/5109_1 /TAXON_ID=181622 /ORGANISM="Strombidinopsis sp, Strain SopsisLIS2011" /LENGTH=50 /DNA_ID=CAMNT_0004516501 /DNA_START=16 /DNA_END=168 /DNA_ORIENTATION=+
MEERFMENYAETFGEFLIRYKEVTEEELEEYNRKMELITNTDLQQDKKSA